MNAGNLGPDDLVMAKNLQNKYSDKVVELGCHPGFEGPELAGKYKRWGGYHWRQELETLKK